MLLDQLARSRSGVHTHARAALGRSLPPADGQIPGEIPHTSSELTRWFAALVCPPVSCLCPSCARSSRSALPWFSDVEWTVESLQCRHVAAVASVAVGWHWKTCFIMVFYTNTRPPFTVRIKHSNLRGRLFFIIFVFQKPSSRARASPAGRAEQRTQSTNGTSH